MKKRRIEIELHPKPPTTHPTYKDAGDAAGEESL